MTLFRRKSDVLSSVSSPSISCNDLMRSNAMCRVENMMERKEKHIRFVFGSLISERDGNYVEKEALLSRALVHAAVLL